MNGPFWRVFENLKIEKETFLGDFQPICNSSTCDSLHNNDEEESCETQQKEGLYFKQRRIAFVMPIRK